MKIQLYHCGLQLSPAHRIDLRGYNCVNTQITKLQRVSDYDDVRLYEFKCPKCDQLLYAWMGMDHRGKMSPLIKIQPSHMKIWDAWIAYRNIVNPQGVDTVKRSKPIFPFTMQTVPVA